jgi:predicted AlkP superfamily phosphohydrolase/phosphomutase
MGVDRIQHAFWRHFDTEHPQHEAASPFAGAIFDYYRHLDAEIGELLELIPADATVFVVSDHGARALHGSFCFNEWLVRHGFLVLKDSPRRPAPLTPDRIDWGRTRAWGEGGYYGRLFLNVRGREPQGTVEPDDTERLRRELIDAIAEIDDAAGNRLGCEALQPEDLYAETRGVPPDLMVYFGNLRWRAAGGVGYPSLWVDGTDVGPDDANHDWSGVFIARAGEQNLGGRRLDGLRLGDMASTLLSQLEIEAPRGIGGRPIDLGAAAS